MQGQHKVSAVVQGSRSVCGAKRRDSEINLGRWGQLTAEIVFDFGCEV